jgi:DNA-binding transcriptional LysR family regulator
MMCARYCNTQTSRQKSFGHSTPFAEILPKILRAFQRAMPNVHVRLHNWSYARPPKASSLRDVRYEELFHERVCLAVAPNHPFARRRSVPLTHAVCEPFIALTREGYPVYYDYLLAIFAPVKQKPRVVEEHDSYSGVLSAVEAGTGVAIGVDVFGYSFGNRCETFALNTRAETDCPLPREKKNLA